MKKIFLKFERMEHFKTSLESKFIVLIFFLIFQIIIEFMV